MAPRLSLDFSSFATKRPGVRIPSRPPIFSTTCERPAGSNSARCACPSPKSRAHLKSITYEKAASHVTWITFRGRSVLARDRRVTCYMGDIQLLRIFWRGTGDNRDFIRRMALRASYDSVRVAGASIHQQSLAACPRLGRHPEASQDGPKWCRRPIWSLSY